MTSGYDVVRVTLHGVTHSARQDATDGWGFTACGRATHRDRDKTRSNEVAPDVDCMSCLVAEART